MMVKLFGTFISALKSRRILVLENLALRQQLAILKRTKKRSRLNKADRLFWIILSRIWRDWSEPLVVVKPETVIGWHRNGFKLFWSWKSRRRGKGRPKVPREIRDLIRRMSSGNPLWGAPKIHGELLSLRLVDSTIATLGEQRDLVG